MPPVHLSCGTRVTSRKWHVLEGELGTCPAFLVGSCAEAISVAVQQQEKLSCLFPRQFHKTGMGNKVKSREQQSSRGSEWAGFAPRRRAVKDAVSKDHNHSVWIRASRAATSLGAELSCPAGITENTCWQESSSIIPPPWHKAMLCRHALAPSHPTSCHCWGGARKKTRPVLDGSRGLFIATQMGTAEFK